jgi:hypothetical protein
MMKKVFKRSIFFVCILIYAIDVWAQSDWPKTITVANGFIIKIYQPQPESFSGNTLKSRSAISVVENSGEDPIFGVFWSTAKVETDRDSRQMSIESVKVTELKIPAETNQFKTDLIKTSLESFIPKVAGVMSLDEVLAQLDQDIEEDKLSRDLSNKLPKVIYTSKPSMLVLIDGVPRLKKNKEWGLNVVVNSPFTIVEGPRSGYYIYGGTHWYSAPSPTGPYEFTKDKVPRKLRKIARHLQKSAFQSNDMTYGVTSDKRVYNIIVSTSPAVLIQSDGNPDLAPIEGTSLLYVKNSDNDIFVDTKSQLYYVLLSGRWYEAKGLNENSDWEYIASNKLPIDFAKIPEGSPKDNVLASVAGTNAAKEAVYDAQIPQTAKIDRRTANTHVVYDGPPQFEPITGTNLKYAVNTASTVLYNNAKYYALDNGIWFISDSPDGPWIVSTDRPDDVDEIPPTSPVYNAKYVHVYDATPDYVYMGYTPGYLNSYIDGSTVVYGSGYYYPPWDGDEYYPLPWTWGFDMDYSPWFGWGFGLGYDFDWFNMDYGYGWSGWCGGWWGPAIYRPAYRSWGARYNSSRHGGYYGRNALNNGGKYLNMRYRNNLYANRSGIIPRDYGESFGNYNNRLFSAENAIFSDRHGNVFQRGGQGIWQQRMNRQWSPVRNEQFNMTSNLNRQQQMFERGQMRAQNFQRASTMSGMRFGSSGGFAGGGFRSASPAGGGFHGRR